MPAMTSGLTTSRHAVSTLKLRDMLLCVQPIVFVALRIEEFRNEGASTNFWAQEAPSKFHALFGLDLEVNRKQNTCDCTVCATRSLPSQNGTSRSPNARPHPRKDKPKCRFSNKPGPLALFSDAGSSQDMKNPSLKPLCARSCASVPQTSHALHQPLQ